MSANAHTRGRGIGAVLLSALLALMALVPLAATAGAQDASPEASPVPVAGELGLELPEIEIRAQEFGYSITVPAPVAAGQYLVRFVNQTDAAADVNLVLLPEEQTSGDLSGALFGAFTEENDGEFPDFFADSTFVGGSAAEAQSQNEVVLNLGVGRYYVFTTVPGAPQSVQAFSVVTAEEAAGEPAPVATPGASPVASPVADELPSDVQVSATEFAFDGADSASSGPQLWQVTNDGEALHNAVLGVGDEEAVTGDDADIAGAVGILSPGQTAYMLLDLSEDSYTLVDTLPDGEGSSNAEQGMVAAIEVE